MGDMANVTENVTENVTAMIAELNARITTLNATVGAAGTAADYNEALDTIWMLLASILVFLMHAGFSLLEAGSVRFKNTQNILTKNLMVVCLGFLCYWVFGWALTYGPLDDQNRFVGGSQFVHDNFFQDQSLWRQWLFQGVFCATGATIVSGAMAERTQLKGFTLYTIVMTSLIYPVVAHWGWSGEGMFSYTDPDDADKSISFFGGPWVRDFAGSGIVHMVGGVGALCGAVIVGARKGRFDEDIAEEFAGHSVPFVVLGTFILWFGWYGFNPGSTLSMHDAGTAHLAGLVAVNTTLSPCVAALVVFLLRALVFPPKLLDVGGFCNGALAGLVSITAGCAFVEPWESMIIGFIGGIVYQLASMALQKAKIDDVVDAFPVHGVCGMWGVLAVGFFGNPDEGLDGNGVFYGGDQLGTQVVFVIFITAWVGVLSVLIFLPLKIGGMLRLSDEFQDEGADVKEHSPTRAYGEPKKVKEIEV